MTSPHTKLCPRCGLEKPTPFYGRAWCSNDCEEAYKPEHRAEMIRDANARRYDHRKAIGQCQRCNEPARPGGVFCAACAQKKAEAQKAATRRRRARAKR